MAALELFSAADQMLSSAGQAGGQKRQGAHYKFSFSVREKPFPMTALCSKTMIKQGIREKYIFSSCLRGSEFGGVKVCSVLVSFGLIWFGFGVFLVVFKAAPH